MSTKSPDAFRTISEVAEWLGVPTHVLRFWESRFSQVKPVKRAGGRRYYRPADMELLGGIRKLLHEDGMTIRGVQKLLREHGVKHIAAMSPSIDSDELRDVTPSNVIPMEAALPTDPPSEPASVDHIEDAEIVTPAVMVEESPTPPETAPEPSEEIPPLASESVESTESTKSTVNDGVLTPEDAPDLEAEPEVAPDLEVAEPSEPPNEPETATTFDIAPDPQPAPDQPADQPAELSADLPTDLATEAQPQLADEPGPETEELAAKAAPVDAQEADITQELEVESEEFAPLQPAEIDDKPAPVSTMLDISHIPDDPPEGEGAAEGAPNVLLASLRAARKAPGSQNKEALVAITSRLTDLKSRMNRERSREKQL